MSHPYPKPVLFRTRNKREIHRAGWIIPDSVNVIQNGYLEIENGRIKGIHSGVPREACTDHGPGVLMPPLVNAHVHLELSALENRIPLDKGFQSWVKTLLEERAALGRDVLVRAAKKSILDLLTWGNLYVGEISTLGTTKSLLENSGLKGVFFQEFLGTAVEKGCVQKKDDLSFSVAGHAPHTSSPDLLRALKRQSRSMGLPFSIHVAESEAESDFIFQKKGPWADFLTLRGIDYRSWDLGSKTPVSYLDGMGLLDPLTLAVHLLQVTPTDMDILARSQVKVCICPRSNHNLHGRLPDIERMIQKGIRPALGTDSLASCDSLNIWDEMGFIAHHYPGLDPRTIFSMATHNGAKALGLEHVTGTIAQGKRADFIYRPMDPKTENEVFERMVFNEH
ncbi:MAG: amidohydrolase family protein [Desulfobacteraceae bacterium]|nr:amidohydrolase family protein [Desulfobacteraceae bacterium]